MSIIHLCFRDCFSEFCESKPQLRSMEGATPTLALDTLKLGCRPILTLTEDIHHRPANLPWYWVLIMKFLLIYFPMKHFHLASRELNFWVGADESPTVRSLSAIKMITSLPPFFFVRCPHSYGPHPWWQAPGALSVPDRILHSPCILSPGPRQDGSRRKRVDILPDIH